MKNLLLKNWDFVRTLRLLIGLGVGGYAAWAGDYFLAALGGLFIIQAVFNLSCCGSGGCSVASQKKTLYQDVIKPYHPDMSHK
ncbi:hypothetical protein [uncultured Mediterranea sp.]|uniref:hypothetical protein n=1 Tax=uncultured Mediterranea sp. TaxID=1926662 RepID=UPI0025852903|nr:hypothetical protein [uncultured Mediterranea sp.]